jgi:ankyrin repeat protein
MRNLRLLLLSILLLSPAAAYAQDMKEDLLAAARKGNIEAVKSLLDKGVDVNSKSEYGATALSFACDKGHVAVVKLLLERGADANVRDTFYGATPMTWASMKGHAEIVSLLLDKGAGSKEDVLSMGVQGGKPALVRVALDKGGIAQQKLDLALAGAINSNNTEIADMLRKAGAKELLKVDEATLKSYAGTYKNDTIGEIVVATTDGKLTMKVGPQPQLTLGALDKTSFTVIEFDGIDFKFNVEGDKVTSATLKQRGQTFEFKKVN